MSIILKLLIAIILGTLLIGGAYTVAERIIRNLISGEYRIKERVRCLMEKSDKLMSWLYSDKKSLSEQVYEEFCNQQISFIRTDWRNYR